MHITENQFFAGLLFFIIFAGCIGGLINFYKKSEHTCVEAVTERFKKDPELSKDSEWLGKAVRACKRSTDGS